jgi:hypothetical protein
VGDDQKVTGVICSTADAQSDVIALIGDGCLSSD